MTAAKLSIWNNKWTEIFDFTPSKGNYKHKTAFEPGFVANLKDL